MYTLTHTNAGNGKLKQKGMKEGLGVHECCNSWFYR